MEIQSFDNIDDLFSHLNHRNDEATRRLSDQQKAITWGSYLVSAVPDQLMIFGRIPTEAELVEAETSALNSDDDMTPDEIAEEVAGVVALTAAQMESGRLFGSWFSIVEPDGELGYNHKINFWPIDEATFEWAKELRFDFTKFPDDLYEQVKDRLHDLAVHLATTS